MISSVYVQDGWMAAAGAVTLALVIGDAYYSGLGAARIAKASVGLLALMVAFRWPPFVLMAGITFAAARGYYSRRFGEKYPVLVEPS